MAEGAGAGPSGIDGGTGIFVVRLYGRTGSLHFGVTGLPRLRGGHAGQLKPAHGHQYPAGLADGPAVQQPRAAAARAHLLTGTWRRRWREFGIAGVTGGLVAWLGEGTARAGHGG